MVASVDSDAVDGVAHLAEPVGDEDGEPTAPGDEPDGSGWGRGIGQDGEDA